MRPARQTASAGSEIGFDFGKNWLSFVQTGVSEARIAASAAALRRLLGGADLRGRSFLDVGCGSGLSSLAAVRLGARRVVAFDADARCVAAARELCGPSRCEVRQGSVLDNAFLATLEAADVVYAWGSLHHTGAMWQAIDNTGRLLEPAGTLVLAIYNHVQRRFGSSAQWWQIKRWYNRAPPAARRLMEYAYLARIAARDLVALRAPLASARVGRGMDLRHDVRDWLGGFPYEYASAGAVFDYVHGRLGFELRYLNTNSGHGCNEFTFQRPSAR